MNIAAVHLKRDDDCHGQGRRRMSNLLDILLHEVKPKEPQQDEVKQVCC